MAKSDVLWTLHSHFPNAFTYSVASNQLKPADESDGYGEPFEPACVFMDAMTRAYKFGEPKIVIPRSGVDIVQKPTRPTGEALPKWFNHVCDHMLNPGLAMMPTGQNTKGARTFVVVAEGPRSAPAKGYTDVERRYSNSAKPVISDEKRRATEMCMHWRSTLPITMEWHDICRDSYLRKVFLHRMAWEFYSIEDLRNKVPVEKRRHNKTLPINCRVIFDGCLTPDVDASIEHTPGKRVVFCVKGREEYVDEAGRTVVADEDFMYSKSTESSIYEGEQGMVKWVRWACDPVQGKERMRHEKQIFCISHDTDALMTLMQLCSSYLYLPRGGGAEDWTVCEYDFRARIVLWFGKTTMTDHNGHEVLVDVYIWVTRLWAEIMNRVRDMHSRDIVAGIPHQPVAPHDACLSLVAAALTGKNDFAPGIDGLTHQRLVSTYLTHASWIGDIVKPDRLARPGCVVDTHAFLRFLRATFFEAHRARFKEFTHPSAVPFDVLEERIKAKHKKQPERNVPSHESIATHRLLLEYHVMYNELAPQDRVEEIDSIINEFGYARWRPKDSTADLRAENMREVFIPNNMELVWQPEKGLFRALKKVRSTRVRAAPAKRPRESAT